MKSLKLAVELIGKDILGLFKIIGYIFSFAFLSAIVLMFLMFIPVVNVIAILSYLLIATPMFSVFTVLLYKLIYIDKEKCVFKKALNETMSIMKTKGFKLILISLIEMLISFALITGLVLFIMLWGESVGALDMNSILLYSLGMAVTIGVLFILITAILTFISYWFMYIIASIVLDKKMPVKIANKNIKNILILCLMMLVSFIPVIGFLASILISVTAHLKVIIDILDYKEDNKEDKYYDQDYKNSYTF